MRLTPAGAEPGAIDNLWKILPKMNHDEWRPVLVAEER